MERLQVPGSRALAFEVILAGLLRRRMPSTSIAAAGMTDVRPTNQANGSAAIAPSPMNRTAMPRNAAPATISDRGVQFFGNMHPVWAQPGAAER